MERLADFSIRHARKIVFGFVVVAAISLYGTTKLQQEENLLVFLPTQDPDVQLFNEVSRRFGALSVALIGVEAPDGSDVFSADAVAKIATASNRIRDIRGVDRIVSMSTLSDPVSGPAGAELTPLIAAAPKSVAESRALRAKVLSRDFVAGSFVSRDGRAALILAFLVPGAGERQVTDAIRQVTNETLSPLKIYLGGAPFAGRSIYDEAQSDVWKLSPLALLVLFLVVMLSFRDPVGMVLTICSVAFSVLVVLGGMGLYGEHFTVATSTLPVILFASGSSYAVHVLGRYYLTSATLPTNEAIKKALSIVGPPLAIAGGTTAIGFFAFVSTDVRPMRAFGIACGSGVLICWATSLLLVPAVLSLWPRRSAHSARMTLLGEGLVGLWSAARRHRLVVIAGAAAAVAGLVRPMMQVQVVMEPRAFFRVGSEPWQAERFLNERFGGATFVQVALHGDLDDPTTLREIARLRHFARSLDAVSQTNSIIEPLILVNDVMGAGRRLPITRAQAANLYFFLEGEAGMQSLIASGRHDALMHIRVRGDATPVVAAIEHYVQNDLRWTPHRLEAKEITQEIVWVSKAGGLERVDQLRLDDVVKQLALPAADDPKWQARRAEVVRSVFSSEEAPPLAPYRREEVLRLATADDSKFAAELALATANADDAKFALELLHGRLESERRDLAVSGGVAKILTVLGLSPTSKVAQELIPIVDDLFTPASDSSREPLSGRVAGEPILSRGFSRSVDRNQWRSLMVAVVVVLLLLVALFRSLRLAALCVAPSLLTLVVLYGGMGLLGLHIDLGTSLVAGIATGAGSDFAMHYLWYLRRTRADEVSRSVGPIMVVSIVLVSFGFLVLAFGKSPAMKMFGVLAALAMFLSAALTCVLMPAMLKKTDLER